MSRTRDIALMSVGTSAPTGVSPKRVVLFMCSAQPKPRHILNCTIIENVQHMIYVDHDLISDPNQVHKTFRFLHTICITGVLDSGQMLHKFART